MRTSLKKTHTRLTNNQVVCFTTHLHKVIAIGFDLQEERESITKVRLRLVCNLKTLDTMLQLFCGKDIEDMLDVLDAVDVAINVNIAIECVNGAYQMRISELETAMPGNRTDIFFIRNNVTLNVTIVELK